MSIERISEPQKGEPDYIAQASMDELLGQPTAWIKERCGIARERGCVVFRASLCPQGTWPHLNLVLVEGWKDRNAYQGDPHWQLAKAEGKQP